MTFSIGHVQGGTGAGWRRALHKKYVPWACDCPSGYTPNLHVTGPKINPGYLKKCIDCKVSRDQ